jgi:NADH-quinone oxidoreductase subunit G
MNKGAGLYFHPIGDPIVNGYAKNMMTIEHKTGAEEYALCFVLSQFGDKESMPKELADILESAKTDDYLNLPENFEAAFKKMLAKKDTFALVIGEDAYTHKNSKNIARLAGAVERYTDFSVVVIPSQTNTLGVSLICDLDEERGENILGYNEKGDFTLSALGEGDLDMPALNQQEGTFTNIDKRVVPTNAALEYNGYILNDIANALGITKKYTTFILNLNFEYHINISKKILLIELNDHIIYL